MNETEPTATRNTAAPIHHLTTGHRRTRSAMVPAQSRRSSVSGGLQCPTVTSAWDLSGVDRFAPFAARRIGKRSRLGRTLVSHGTRVQRRRRTNQSGMFLGLFATGVEDALNRVLNLYFDVSPRRWPFADEDLWDNTPLDARKRLVVKVLKDLDKWDAHKGLDKRIETMAKFRNRLAHSIVVVPFADGDEEPTGLQIMGRAGRPEDLSQVDLQSKMSDLMQLVREFEGPHPRDVRDEFSLQEMGPHGPPTIRARTPRAAGLGTPRHPTSAPVRFGRPAR